MSGPVRPPLKTQLDNGTSENRPVNTIAFANTDFTLTNSGTKTTVGLSGGGGGTIGGTIAANQVAFGTAADTIGGDASFTFDTTGTPKLKLLGTTPRLYLGDTDVSSQENEMLLIMKSGNTSFIYDRQNLGSLSLGAGDITNCIVIKPDGEMIFNEAGNAEADFRVESDAYQDMFLIDAGLNKAHFGTGGIDNALGLVQINVGNSTQNALTVTSTDGDASQAPTIEFYRNSASATADDKLGQLNFTGKDDNGDKVIYAQMYAQIDNAVAGSHDGRLVIDVTSNAAGPINVFRADKDEVIINDVSFALDTRIETNGNENMFFVDGSTDTIGIGGLANADSTLSIYAGTTAGDATLELISTQDDQNAAPIMQFYRDDIPSASDQTLGEIEFYGRDLGGNRLRMAQISAFVNDATAGGVESTLKFQTLRSSSARELAQWDSYITDFNPSGADCDFRIRSNNRASMFELNGGTDTIGIYSAPTTGLADNNPVLQVNGSVSSKCAIVTKTSATVDLSTRDSNELIGQLYVLTSTSAKTFTVPTSCTQGDWFRVLTTGANGMNIVSTGGATLNGATPASLTRNALNEIYTVVAIATDKWVCTSN